MVPDHNTKARADTDATVNNAVTFAAAMKAVMPLIDPRMVGNPDASHFTFKRHRGKVVALRKHKKCLRQELGTDVPVKAQPGKGDDGDLGFGIKYYCFITTGGCLGPPIYIVADPKMKAGEIDVHKLPNFGIDRRPDSISFLVFMKQEFRRSASTAGGYKSTLFRTLST